MPRRTRSESESAIRSRLGSNCSAIASAERPNTSRWTIARSPSSAQAGAEAPVKLASATVVIPERSDSAAPSLAIATASPSSRLPLRSMWTISQRSNVSPSPKPA